MYKTKYVYFHVFVHYAFIIGLETENLIDKILNIYFKAV